MTSGDQAAVPLLIATILREEGNTGVHTHIQQLGRYLDGYGRSSTIITPFSWGGPLRIPVFGMRLALKRPLPAASVVWYRHWHEVFLRNALRKQLARLGDCVIYAQCPLSARAALATRQGPHQRVVLGVHFRVSQADEWAGKELIKDGGPVFRAIRRLEQETIPQVDGIVYVSEWSRRALTGWCPAAAAVPSAVIGNFIAPHVAPVMAPQGDLVTTGHLEPAKNHRYLLDVLAAANRAGSPLTLDVFGDGPLRADLTRKARALGLADQVRFRGFRRDIRDFLPWYRVYVHASYSESSSLAIMEAMAAGLPAVVADIGPLSELVEDGTEGKFWPLDDPEQAASVLLSLLDDEATLLKATQAAGERFRRDFHAAAVGPRLRSFLFDETAACT